MGVEHRQPSARFVTLARLMAFLSGLVPFALPEMASAAQPQRVQAVLAGDPVVVARLASVLRSSFEREGLSLATVTVPRVDPSDTVRALSAHAAGGPVARLWLDLSARPPTLFLVGARSDLVFVRRLAVHESPDAVETELIRFVVDRSVDAVLKGNPEGVSRQEFEHDFLPAPVLPVALAKPVVHQQGQFEPRQFALSAGYFGVLLGASALSNGPELCLDLREPAFRLSLMLLQSFPLTVTRDDVQLRLLSTGFRIAASLPIRLGPFVASLGLGAGLDATHISPAATGATPAFWASDPVLSAVGTLEYAWGSLVSSFHAGVDGAPEARYVVLRSGTTSTLWSPWRLRPIVGLRLGYAF